MLPYRTLNYIWPNTVYKSEGRYYIQRPWLINRLSNYFDVNIFCNVKEVEDIDDIKYTLISPNIKVKHIFESVSVSHLLKKYSYYRTQIKNSTEFCDDIFFTLYPYKKRGVVLSHMLRHTNLCIWVISDYVELFKKVRSEGRKKAIKRLTYPFLKITFPALSRRIFRNNLIFHTADILYTNDNHRNNIPVIAGSPMNRDPNRVKTGFSHKILYIGDDSEQKGLRRLINALNLVNSGIELTVIGMEQGDLTSPIKYDNIHFMGELYDRKAFYDIVSGQDFIVVPSVAERQGKVQLEAMSTGVVPICADTGGVYSTVTHLYNGILYEERSPNELAKWITKLYSNENLYKRLQYNALNSSSQYGIEHQCEKMAEIIHNRYSYEEK